MDDDSDQDLRRANMFLDSIVENIPLMIFVKDAEELRFERFNRAGEELLGRSREDLLGKNDHDFFPADQAEFFQAKDRQTLRGGVVVDIPEEPIETPHGVRWLHTKKIPLLDEHGTPLHLLGISEDITDKKLAREELERRVLERTAELERAHQHLRDVQKLEAVGRLAGGVAHDFNNLLTVVMTQAASARSRADDPDRVRASCDAIVDAARRAATLTRQLLAFSRQQVLQLRTIDLAETVGEMEPMLRRVIGEQIVLRVETYPNLCVNADPGQLEQVILNLVINARDAMPSGGKLDLALSVRNLPEHRGPVGLAPGAYAVLSVKDRGVGMDAETVSHIFEPFFTTKPSGQGTGLGLATAYGIVAQSGGVLAVDSEPGVGTEFSAYFPRVLGTTRGTTIPSRGAQPNAVRGTLLLVEDDLPVRQAIHAALASSGFHVIEARDAADAQRLFRIHAASIDALISDLVMPGVGGRELVRLLRTQRSDLPVLFVSGYAPPADLEMGPGEEFLAKPFDPDELVARVSAIVAGQRR